jgi:hypothetical protein
MPFIMNGIFSFSFRKSKVDNALRLGNLAKVSHNLLVQTADSETPA